MIPRDIAERRAGLISELFPERWPRLWCPPLTHYRRDGTLDPERCAAHLAFLTRWAKGLLVPGSTGDAWDLDPEETRVVLDLALVQAHRLGAHVLVGALNPDAGQAARFIRDTMARLADLPHGRSAFGFAVCPPRGAELTQADLAEALSELLSLGVPLALYQLPQVTENEMSPELVEDLAARFPNFILFKDSSGEDRVAAAGLDLGGAYLVRGAEGEYAGHLKTGGGRYDGLLLSTANSFGEQLSSIIELSAAGREAEARRLSDRLSSLVRELFRAAEAVPAGNVFTNSAKAADHFFAHGPRGLDAPPPRLHAGIDLPLAVLEATRDSLLRHELMPQRGYLE
jgi:dihydrodipicolinate synthase/N-acetylneuraminate lyase